MSVTTNASARIEKALAYEKFVLIVSFWIAVAMFLAAYVLGNLASYLDLAAPKDLPPIPLSTAALWFAQALIGFAMLGTLINALSLVAALLSDLLGRTRKREG